MSVALANHCHCLIAKALETNTAELELRVWIAEKLPLAILQAAYAKASHARDGN